MVPPPTSPTRPELRSTSKLVKFWVILIFHNFDDKGPLFALPGVVLD